MKIKNIKYIYVLDDSGKPLMPTKRLGMVRRWLQSGQAFPLSSKKRTTQPNPPLLSKIERSNTMQIYHQLITELMPHLQDGMQHQRRVLAVYLSGSTSRNMQNANSDLDLIILVKESKYDLLTNAKLVKQIKFTNQTILQEICKQSGLKLSPESADLKIIDLRYFYREISKMNPNIIDMVNRGPLYVRKTIKPDWIKQNKPSNLIVNLKQIDYFNLNQLAYLGAVLGMANNMLKHLDNDHMIKEVDLINYFIKLIKPHLLGKAGEIPYKVVISHNYHQELVDIDADVLRLDARRDLTAMIHYLEQARNAALIDLKNPKLHDLQQKNQNKLADLFIREI